MKYKADIGTWEEGRSIEFEAADRDAALAHANSQCKGGLGDHVVQLYQLEDGKYYIIFDFMNGFTIYDR